jgi:hypothetical protein
MRSAKVMHTAVTEAPGDRLKTAWDISNTLRVCHMSRGVPVAAVRRR